MALLSILSVDRLGGCVLDGVAASVGGDLMPNGGQEALAIVNGSGAPITVTAAITELVDGVTPAGKAITVAAGKTAIFGPFPPSEYNNGQRQVAFTYSAVTTVTVKAIQLIGVANT